MDLKKDIEATKGSINHEHGNFINGEFEKSHTGKTFDSINPATLEPIAKFQDSDEHDIDRAVKAAKDAHPKWAATSVEERAGILINIANVIQENATRLAIMETLDNGKPIRETTGSDIPLAADHFLYFASVIRAEEHKYKQLEGSLLGFKVPDPYPVAGQVIPWNFPLLMAAWKIAPAIAAGSCVVVKPAEETPLTIMVLMQLIADIVPPGVVNVVTGYGETAGGPLVEHPDVDKVAFTGSSEVGHIIEMAAAKQSKPVTLELGGKSANIVFDDCNIEKAAEGAVLATAFNQGEVCTCGSRLLVHESIYDEFIERVQNLFNKIVVGDPLDMNTQVGAQVSHDQYTKIMTYLDWAHSNPDSCEVLAGGTAVDDLNGYFIHPTMVATHNQSKLSKEEIFGPVLAVMKFKDEAEAIALANESSFSLGAGIWTQDINRMTRVAKSLDAGRIWGNCYHHYPAGAPFGGGFKGSGKGRETDAMALDNYRLIKSVVISLDEKPTGLFS